MDDIRYGSSSRSPSPRREVYSRSPSPNEVDRSEDEDGPNGDADGRILSENEEEGTAQRNSDDDEEKKKEQKKKSAKPKGPVRRTLISEDMLSGKNGITKVQELFKDFQFQGKGREKEDLNRVLNKLEQWTHMLYPKHPFEQCLERVEFLGMKKKSMKTLMKRMRMGLLSYGDDDNRRDTIEDDDSNPFPTEEDAEIPAVENPPGGDEFGSDDDFDVGVIDDLERGVMSSSNRTDPRQTTVLNSNPGEPTLEEIMEFEQEQARANGNIPELDEDIDDHMDVDADFARQNDTNTGTENNSTTRNESNVEMEANPNLTNDVIDNGSLENPNSTNDIASVFANFFKQLETLRVPENITEPETNPVPENITEPETNPISESDDSISLSLE